ncbi:FAD-dependent monooxygenase [Motilimonas cestriensis]|uniref:FAD-dependent monooxygenase n=1 Tax=Motilimonas cestriensis TaxID=2742685 RepID=A0ABS8WDF3_9GAMM|nr:FAD-dependent monooxygenase [Motilimonas cestriensis]
MQSFDLVIVGGGMVGLTLARALYDAPIKIAVIEGRELEPEFSEIADNRVSAINAASQTVLEKLGVWPNLNISRSQAYEQMQVWDQDSFAQLQFSAQQNRTPNLGHIIENRNLQLALLNTLETQENVRIFCPQRIAQLALGEGEAWITLDNGHALTSKLVVGADGAESWVRKQAAIPLTFRDYQHHALVATIATAECHQNTAWQIFKPEGPLAFLPLFNPHHCSIVWSTSPERASMLMELSDDEFNKQLAMAFDNRLGLCQVLGDRHSVPLRMRYARDFAKHRVALIGDAAHTIHPLAGQGVNLGLMDATALAQEIKKNLALGLDIGQLAQLRGYERWRKSQAMEMIVAMEALKQGFSGQHPLKKLIRDVGLSLVNNAPLVKNTLLKQAMGLAGELPELARL